MQLSNLIIGVVLLLFGRRLFWLVIGVAGFLFGMEMTGLYFAGLPEWLQLAVAIGLGCLGALLAKFAQRLAFSLGGFFAGVFLALRLGQLLTLPENGVLLLVLLGAGIVGAILATLLMDQAITLLACLVGAGAIVGELPLGRTLSLVTIAILTGAGFLFQERLLPRAKKEAEPDEQA